jgi:hypothetical protein
MPYRNEVRPVNLFGDYMAGRQAAYGEEEARQGNALRGLQIDRARSVNALAGDPKATPEQYIRAGDAATGGALANVQHQQQMDKQQALSQLANLAQKALTIQDPAQRKGFLAQAQQMYGPAFTALGADLSKFPEMLQMPDEALAQKLQEVARFATPEKPDAYTLSQGQKRFEGSREVASVAPAPDTSGANVNQQLITRPVGNGMVQDFAWNPRTNNRQPAGEPYKPVTPHTGNVTEGERKAAALGTRLELAMQDLEALEKTNPGASRPGVMERMAEGIGSETGANALRSSSRQQADTAQLDALDAALTLATGAAYTADQLKNLRKSYFPQIGDSDPTVAAKKKRFQTIVQTARIASGRAEPSIDRAVNARNTGAPQQQAPPQAIDFLRQHPETRDAFQAKYGYLP